MYRAKPADGVAWVTGASSGIGRAVGSELARRGYVVAATARRADELRGLAAEAAAAGGRIVGFPGDVTDRGAMAALVAEIEAALGPIALGFFNAGANFPDPPGVLVGEGFRKTFALNFDGTINCLGPTLAAMQQRGRGQVAVTASLAGYIGMPRFTAYGASKAALIALCESLRFDLEPQGITIQAVCPGFVKTPMTADNRFTMPLLVDLGVAAQRICDGFEKGGFEITFPRRLSYLLKFMTMLPYGAYFPLMGSAMGTRRSPAGREAPR